MEFPIKETLEDGNPIRKSISRPVSPYRGAVAGAGGSSRTRRYSSSQKSTSEEGDTLPNYLKASTGSCHDFCKYGRKHEQLKSRNPIIPKRSAIVNKEKLTKTVAPAARKIAINHIMHAPLEPIEGMEQVSSLQSKKLEVSKHNSSTSRSFNQQKRPTSYMKPKPVIMNPSSTCEAPAGSNGGTKKKDANVKKTGMIPQAKKVMAKVPPTGSVSTEPSVSRNVSLNARKSRILKPASPLQNQNCMPKSELNQSIVNKVQEKVLHIVEAEHEEALEEGPSIPPTVFKSSQDSSDNKVLDEEVENPDGVEVQSSCEEVLEGEFEYTDNEEAFVSEKDDKIETSKGIQNRKGRMMVCEGKDDDAVKLKFIRGKVLNLQSDNNGARKLKFKRGTVIDDHEHEHRHTIARRTYKKKDDDEVTNDSNNDSESVVLKHQIVQGKKDGQVLLNNVIEETASKLVESRKSKVKALVGAFETVISLQDVKPSSSS